jgi:hypothetical protein
MASWSAVRAAFSVHVSARFARSASIFVHERIDVIAVENEPFLRQMLAYGFARIHGVLHHHALYAGHVVFLGVG